MPQFQADKADMLKMASDLKTPATKLLLITNKYKQVNYLLSLHPKSNKKILNLIIEKVESFRYDKPEKFDDYELNDELVLKNISRHPKIDANSFIDLANRYPDDALKNPSLMRFFEDKTLSIEKINRLFESSNLPVALMRLYAAQGTQPQKLALMRNCNLPSDVKRKLTPDKIHRKILRRLKQITNKTEDKFLKRCLDRYSQKSKLFCVPRFLPFDRFDLLHRLQDQILCGFPYTSAKWSWPVDASGDHMQPFAQIDLQNASKLLNEFLGDGILQLWTSPRIFENVELTIRVIPRCDGNYPMDNFYPDKALWLKKSSNSELDFDNCICFDILKPYLHGFDLDQCRIEWVYLTRMFGYGIYDLIFHDKNSDLSVEQEIQSDNLMSKIEEIDDSLSCDENIVKAGDLYLSLKRETLCTLGGFPARAGVNTRNHFWGDNFLFVFQSETDVINTIAITYHKKSDGSVSFSSHWYLEN